MPKRQVAPTQTLLKRTLLLQNMTHTANWQKQTLSGDGVKQLPNSQKKSFIMFVKKKHQNPFLPQLPLVLSHLMVQI